MTNSVSGALLALLIAMSSSASVSSPGAAASEPDEPPPYHAQPLRPRRPALRPAALDGDRPPSFDVPAGRPQGHRPLPLERRWALLSPGSVAINGMKRIDAYRDTGDLRQLEQALVQAEHLRRAWSSRTDDAWWLPFWFDYPPEGLDGARGSTPCPRGWRSRSSCAFTGSPVMMPTCEAAEKLFESYRRLGRKQGRIDTSLGRLCRRRGISVAGALSQRHGPTTCSTPICTRSSASTSTGSTRAHPRRASCSRVR